MKTIFIVNPCAGQGNKAKLLIDKIRKENCDLYITKTVGDATRYVKEYIKKYGPARFIACGGDGTFNEVLNGVENCADAHIGLIPIGTGNDFCRNFDSSFDNVSKQLDGEVVKCDAIRYTIQNDGGEISGYCANMLNIGFDCNVADMTANMKKKPFISGSMAYLAATLTNLIGKKGANLKIEIDNQVKHCGKLLLTTIANGSYCGGGVKSNPLASVRDGKININIVKDVSRLRFLRLLPSYINGTLLNVKNIDQVVFNTSCQKITVTPLDGKMRLCIDGEIIDAGKTTFEICPGVFNFIVPDKSQVASKI